MWLRDIRCDKKIWCVILFGKCHVINLVFKFGKTIWDTWKVSLTEYSQNWIFLLVNILVGYYRYWFQNAKKTWAGRTMLKFNPWVNDWMSRSDFFFWDMILTLCFKTSTNWIININIYTNKITILFIYLFIINSVAISCALLLKNVPWHSRQD